MVLPYWLNSKTWGMIIAIRNSRRDSGRLAAGELSPLSLRNGQAKVTDRASGLNATSNFLGKDTSGSRDTAEYLFLVLCCISRGSDLKIMAEVLAPVAFEAKPIEKVRRNQALSILMLTRIYRMKTNTSTSTPGQSQPIERLYQRSSRKASLQFQQ